MGTQAFPNSLQSCLLILKEPGVHNCLYSPHLRDLLLLLRIPPSSLPVMYGFNLGESILPFLGVTTALAIAAPAYCGYYHYIVEPRVKRVGFGPPEGRLVPGLLATFFVPVGLFIFGPFFSPTHSPWCPGYLADKALHSLDIETLHPLDHPHNRCLRSHDGMLYHSTSALPLPSFHLPSIRGFALRSQ
jgi:hypothetical protein